MSGNLLKALRILTGFLILKEIVNDTSTQNVNVYITF